MAIWAVVFVVMSLAAIYAIVFMVMSLGDILGPTWVGLYALPAGVLVVVIYGAIKLATWMTEGPKRIVAYGVAVVFLALLVGFYADAMNYDDLKLGCHTDYYLWVIPVGGACIDP
jgi:hypothetical protein